MLEIAGLKAILGTLTKNVKVITKSSEKKTAMKCHRDITTTKAICRRDIAKAGIITGIPSVTALGLGYMYMSDRKNHR